MKGSFRWVLLTLLLLTAMGCNPSSTSEVRGVYLVLPGDRIESNEIQQELTNVDIPGPPETDFRLPDGVIGVSRVVDADGNFGARVQFLGGAVKADVDAFIAQASARLGPESVMVLTPGEEWPDCAGVRADCQLVDG